MVCRYSVSLVSSASMKHARTALYRHHGGSFTFSLTKVGPRNWSGSKAIEYSRTLEWHLVGTLLKDDFLQRKKTAINPPNTHSTARAVMSGVGWRQRFRCWSVLWPTISSIILWSTPSVASALMKLWRKTWKPLIHLQSAILFNFRQLLLDGCKQLSKVDGEKRVRRQLFVPFSGN